MIRNSEDFSSLTRWAHGLTVSSAETPIATWLMIPLCLCAASCESKIATPDQPRQLSIRVADVRGTLLILEDGRELQLAGVREAEDEIKAVKLGLFIRMLTLNGVDIIRQVGQDSYFVKCLVRGRARCGAKDIPYREVVVNEMVVLSGCARLADDQSGLTDRERRRLLACVLSIGVGWPGSISPNDFVIRRANAAADAEWDLAYHEDQLLVDLDRLLEMIEAWDTCLSKNADLWR
jgi:hypothetical protein